MTQQNIWAAGILCFAMLTPPLAHASEKEASTPILSTQQLLTDMESPAEDMLDAIAHANRPLLKHLYTQLSQQIDQLNQRDITHDTNPLQSMNIIMQNAWFDLISVEIQEMDDMPALSNAINQFSGQLIITTSFQQPEARTIAWMDYLGRALLQLSEHPSASPLQERMLESRRVALQSAWDSIKHVMQRDADGLTLIQQVDPVIQALMVEKDAHHRVILANQELDWVDRIEAYFHI